jgi:hypothetical protein
VDKGVKRRRFALYYVECRVFLRENFRFER